MDCKTPQIHLVYNRRKRASKYRKASVELRISYNYQQKYISTGIMLYPNQWKNGSIVNHPEIHHVSQILNNLLSNVREILIEMIKENNIQLKDIPTLLIKKGQPALTFIDFCEQRISVRKYGKKSDTQQRYDRFMKHFKRWDGIHEFKDVTDDNIIKFDTYLNNKNLKHNSKWHNYHRFLNSFIIDAIDAGHIKRNPYKWVNINKRSDNDSLHKCLTPEEFYKICGSEMPTESLYRVRDLFVFQTYTCLSYTDLKNFNADHIQNIDGMKVYVGNRDKTGKQYTIPLLPPALNILSRYNNKLPIISNVKYNEYLKVVAQAAGINKPVSTHWARHTGATMLLNAGVDMRIVSKICGHSSTKITEQVYAKLLDETVVEAIRGIHI